jgi:hypothetical protein
MYLHACPDKWCHLEACFEAQRANEQQHTQCTKEIDTIITHRTQKIWNGNGPQFFLTQRLLHLELQNFNWVGR